MPERRIGAGPAVQLRKDIWACAIVGAPIQQIRASGTLEGWPLTWIPGSGDLRYLADPFGLWRGGRLYVFAERFDYRDAVGRIAVSVYDGALNLVEQAIVLSEPWHLSYPFLWEADGETWLLPESFQSGGLCLYRAVAFPHRWERVARIALDHVPLDATPFHDGERWWLFYAPAFPAAARLTQLCAAWAHDPAGAWHPVAGNPIYTDAAGARPGGTPFREGGQLVLPVQDCTGTYGAAVRLLRFDHLSPERITVVPMATLRPPAAAAPFVDGLHTLASAGPVTLIDVKQTMLSIKGLAVRPLRAANRRRRAAAPLLW